VKVIEHIYSCARGTRIPKAILRRFPGARIGTCEQCGASVIFNEPAFLRSVDVTAKMGLTLSKVCAQCVDDNLGKGGKYIAVEAPKR